MEIGRNENGLFYNAVNAATGEVVDEAVQLKTAENDLGRNDPHFEEILNMLRTVKHCCQSLEDSVVKGRKIEKF